MKNCKFCGTRLIKEVTKYTTKEDCCFSCDIKEDQEKLDHRIKELSRN